VERNRRWRRWRSAPGSVGRTVEAAPVPRGGGWLIVGGVEAGGGSGCLPGGAGCEVDAVPALGWAPWQSGRLQRWWPEVREDLPVSRAWTRMVRWPPGRDGGSPRSSSGRRLPRPARAEELHLELLAASYPTNSSSCCCRSQLRHAAALHVPNLFERIGTGD
jgi:hypothetical protein